MIVTEKYSTLSADTDNYNRSSDQPKKPHPIDIHVGERIRLRRKILKLSQSDLAKGVGITFQQVQKYEKGLNRIGAGRLYDIAQILGVEISFFFHELPHEEAEVMTTLTSNSLRSNARTADLTRPVATSDPLTSNETLKLIHYYNRLSVDGKQQILSLCHFMSQGNSPS